MPRKPIHIPNQLRLLLRRRRSTDTPPERDGLACYLALEGTQDELWFPGCGGWVEGVESWIK